MTPRAWAEAGKFPGVDRSDFDAMGYSIGNVSLGQNQLGVQLRDATGKDVRILCRVVMQRPPSRWGEDPRQALTTALSSEPLEAWLVKLDAWAATKIPGRGEMTNTVRENCFGERFVKAKLAPMFRFYDGSDAQTPMPEQWSTPAAAWKPLEAWALLRVGAYELNGQRGLSLKLLALQPV